MFLPQSNKCLKDRMIKPFYHLREYGNNNNNGSNSKAGLNADPVEFKSTGSGSSLAHMLTSPLSHLWDLG